MKKILLLAAVVLCSLVSMADNFTIGNYVGNETGGGLGLGSATTVKVGTVIPKSVYQYATNLKVVGVRFGLAQSASVKSVAVTAEASNGGPSADVLATANVAKTCPKGWTEVKFTEPVAVDPSWTGIFACYEVNLTAQGYPISCLDNAPGNFYCYGPFNQDGSFTWENFGNQYGSPCIQLLVECDPLGATVMDVTSVAVDYTAKGQPVSNVVKVVSTSGKAVTSIDYTLTVNGEQTDKTAQVNIPAGFGVSAQFTVNYTAPDEVGECPVSVRINKVNGEENASTSNYKVWFLNVLSRQVPRYSVVEEFTGTGCPWCTRGWAGMEIVKKKMSDKAGVIAWHYYNSNDPMYYANYPFDALGFTGAPSCVVDRHGKPVDPYYADSDDDGEHITAYIEECNKVVPTVTVGLTAKFSADMKKVEATANTEFLTNLAGSTIAFAVTGDGITGSTTAWKQYNNYASYSAADMGVSSSETELYQFCKGQSKGQSSVSLVYDDVLLASSYSSTGGNLAPKFSTTKVGETATSTYNLTLPTKTTLKAALKYDQMYVTAIVLNPNGTVANAARCKVEMPEGIGTVLNDNDNHSDNNYDLSGRMINAQSKGLMIQGGKKILR